MTTKTSKHTITFANTGKCDTLNSFLDEYQGMVFWFVDYLWTNKVTWGKSAVLDVKNNKLDVPNFISTVGINYTTDLSERAIKRASSDALAIIKSQVAKRKRQLYMLAKLMRSGENTSKLQRAIDSNPLVKPSKADSRKSVMLDSNNCKFIPNKTNEFDGFLKIYSIGKKYGHIYIPVKFTKHSNKLKAKGYAIKTSWVITPTSVNSIWELSPKTSIGTKILGADQGYTTCLSLSDGQVTGKCSHGHDLTSIIDKMNRQQAGSKAFARSQEHRTNYINWSINQLNLVDVKELRLEEIKNIRRGSSSSKSMGHWTYTAINTQVMSRCEELGVPVVKQSSQYRSQRCSDCGWTQKSNRKGKEFICKQCGYVCDADVNGALNHEADLYRLPFGFWQMKVNRTGFYWTQFGVFLLSGQEITVPDVQNV